MDEWEAVIKCYKEDNNPKTLQNILNQVQELINNDLAPFEVEYILSTLLGKPINLLHTVRDKRTKEEWIDCVSDTLKLLAKLVSVYSNIDIFFKDIVSLCLLPYTPRIRQLALTCLINIVPKCALPATDVTRHLNALEETNTCVAPLIMLIGAICEHHPEQITENFNRIWRIFLNLLDDNKKTMTIKKVVLQGILSLFKHYGVELSTLELDQFYGKLILYTKTLKFQGVCLSILEYHSDLFRERLSNDVSFRNYLWNLENSRSVILSVYKCVVDTIQEAKLEKIIEELEKNINSPKYYRKFTALYAILYINTKCTANTNLNEYIDIQTVDFEIRNGNINYEICDAIFWCVKSKVLYSDKLLQTALLFYENFTHNKRKELLQCFIEADVTIRKPASIFLTNYPQSLIWMDLLKMIDENEQNVNSVIKYVQSYIINILEREENNLNINREVLPNNIKSLATILAFLPSLSSFRVLSRYAKMYKEFVPSAILYGNDIRGENISIGHCLNDDDKLRCSVSYVDKDDYLVSEMIIALETILSRTDVSASNLKKAINKLEKIIQRKQLNEEEMSKILYKVHIVFQRMDKTKKDYKILERNIILFIAQYGQFIEKTEKNCTFIKQLENILIWEVDNNLKLKLGTLIVQAMEYDNIDALNILYKLICSKLAKRKDSTLRKAFLSVITKLSRYDVDQNVTNDPKSDLTCDVTRDVMSNLWEDVDGVMELFQFIMEEKSMKSRKAACNILEEVLRSDETELLENLLKNLLVVELNDSNNQSILELLEICIKKLEGNNLLSKKFLPNIILKVLNIKKYNNYIFNTTGNLFTDKIELFDTNTIDDTIDNMLKIINKMGSDGRFNITMVLNFTKKIFDLGKNSKSITEYYFDGNKKINLYILIDIKIIFQLDDSKCKEIISRDDFSLFDEFDDSFCKDSIFDFMRTFSDNLLKTNKQTFFSAISKCLKGLSPRQMSFDNIQFCLSLIKSHDETHNERIQESVKEILEKYPIKEITEGIEKYSFDSHYEIYILALKMFLECYTEPILIEFSEILIKRWFERIAGLHELGVIERNLGSKMEYLTDLVDVSMRFISREDLRRFLVNDEGVKFCRTFIKATFNRLIEKPYITLSPGAESASVVLVDILQYAAANAKTQQAVEMAEHLWPTFCNVSTHEEKIQALTHLPSLPPLIEQWVINAVNDKDTKFERKIEFIIATGDKISGLHSVLRAHLPSRLSELRNSTATCFRLYLDVLSRKNMEVLEQVAQMAANDDTKGWWDDAIEMCMNAAATAGEGSKMLTLVHSRCGTRLLVPLLRSSKTSDVEVFFSNISEDIISTLKKFPRATEHCLYEECVSEYVRALNISQIIFEKVPKENIDKDFVKTVCKLCDTLRDKVDASFREFHCANYNCLVAAICLMDPGAAVYRKLFEPNVWIKLIHEEQIELPIREQRNQRIIRHATCNSTSSVTLTMASARTRMFTRTLSEDPYMYDLTRDDDCDTIQFQEIIVKDNIINRHQCTASFKTLCNKRKGIEDEICRKSLEDTIKNNNIHINVRWLLAQAICNSKEELKAYAGTLQPALLDLLVNTSQDDILNDLHMDVLDTLILWHQNVENEDINKAIGLLINTAIHYGTRNNIYYTLVDRLVKLLNVWQNVVIHRSCFEKHLGDKLKECTHIVKNILKCNKCIQELVPSLIHLIETKQTFIEVCEVFGVALQLENNREQWLTRFQQILQDLYRNDVMEYLKVLYYTQIGCPSVCDYNNCRKVRDLLPKIPAAREKLKCLRILDAYIRNVRNETVTPVLETINMVDHLGSSEGLKLAKTSLRFLSVAEREKLLYAILKENFKKELYQHVEEFLIEYLKLKQQSDYEPPAKRHARESKSLLCNTDKRNILAMLSNCGGDCIHGLSQLLNDDFGIRFYECFYIMIILSKSKSEMSLVRLVDLFMNRFKFESHEEVSSSDVSIHLTREERFNMILKYSKKNPQVALSLTVQLLQVYPKSPEFDFMDDNIVDLLLVPTPWALEINRAADIWRCVRLHNTLSDLMQQTKDTDLEHLTKLLHEEYKLHNEGPKQFSLGLRLCYDENMPEVSTNFSVEDLVTSFGKLSNWSDLTLREQKNVKDELPCLWTTTENFRNIIIEEQFQAPMWLNAMISTYKNDNSVVIPYDVYKSPRTYFDLSVVAEISTWKEIRNGLQTKEIVLSDIQPSDCLARWAARVMMRSVYLFSMSSSAGEAVCALSRSHAAAWCARASETAIYQQVLHCCKTTTDLYESEMLQWLYLKLNALRSIALEENNIEGLQSALDIADIYVPKFLEVSSDENIIKIDLVRMQIRSDLKCLNKNHIYDILAKIEKSKEINISADYKKHLESMCVLFMTFLDQCNFGNDNCRNYNFFTNSIYLAMGRVLSIYVQLNIGRRRRLLANIIINKVNTFGTVLPTETKYILDVFSLIINDLDCISISRLVSSRDLFSGTHSLWTYLDENKVDRVKRYFALIGDPQYLLYSYCQRLLNANNIETFDQIISDLKKTIFDNDLAQRSPDYQILNKFKGNLFSINFEDKEKTREILSSTISQCDQSRAYVCLSQTCSVLASAREIEDVRDALNTLLRLPRGVTVVSFDEKIQIVTNTLSHPAILTCRLSNGRRLRCIVKRGTRVREHCAAPAFNHALGLQHSYRIEPLSDTCCVIEYLENFEPFRKMITDKYNIDIPDISNRTNDKELILDTTRSLEEFQRLCDKLPSYMLRHAIEETAVTVEDFINKKKNFLESVSDMTVFSYIFELDDRHLENMMYSIQDGGACHVDCDAILQDGGDLPPARLTRNVLAVCDTRVLEARIKSKMSRVRAEHRLISPSLSLALAYMGDQYKEKFNQIQNTIQGKGLSFNCTIERLSVSKMPRQEKYIELLKEVFQDFEKKTEYSIEEQVSSLFRQSTDQRILSVTRSGWEPWI